MSRIAIIDTVIDAEYIGGKAIEHYDLCGGMSAEAARNGTDARVGISHGTLCAMMLDHCAVGYELVNIRVFDIDGGKVFGEVSVLAEALELCAELRVDIVSLSAVSSTLSDASLLREATERLAKKAVIISALDNREYATAPTGFPYVVGVRSDRAGLLMPGTIAYCPDDPLGANVCANCNFDFLREISRAPSNSLAVPVVAAYANNLINAGAKASDVLTMLEKIRRYPDRSGFYEASRYGRTDHNETPVVFLAGYEDDMCRSMMDAFYMEYEVQSSALSFDGSTYDARIKKIEEASSMRSDLRFMQRHYKTDLVFIVGDEGRLNEVRKEIDIDVVAQNTGSLSTLRYEGAVWLLPLPELANRLYEILTE